MRDNPRPYERFRHFKGNIYQVLCIANDSETGEEMVVYQALYGDYKCYVRPLAMFMSPVDRSKYPDAPQEYRFERIGDHTLTDGSGVGISSDSMEPAGSAPGTSADAMETAGSAPGIEINTENETETEEAHLDPDVERFLDARTYETRLDILREMRDKITDDMIDIMSTVIDIEIPKARVTKRYDLFVDALEMRRHYEAHRLRM